MLLWCYFTIFYPSYWSTP